MNIIVCLKQTFDTEEKITLTNGRVNEEGVNYILNPYDEYAVEEALRLKEEYGGEVTAITVGPERTVSALQTALAMGVDHAVQVLCENEELDQFGTAAILAAVLKNRPFDLILTGYVSVDKGTGQIAPRLAEALDLAQVTSITKLELVGERKVVLHRDAEGDTEIIEAQLPLIVSAQQGLNEPRYPSLPGIMKAKKKPIEKLSLGEIGLSGKLSKTITVEVFLPPKKAAVKILQGSLQEQVRELVVLIRNEAKVV
ncbi:electron transfer flavoprotein subunit beta/FixA family protein [Brevibacillus marinus]|uniref:electron transfer flavoprotein subunit beta/FixA family protein n=1 Tax=Brevibacillus marinus TaxID=2496837 RepID=UPI000F82E4DC|nr:electron transfer flavoprotein subunit beta/FixA family protein [Brevibacillus marinus]